MKIDKKVIIFDDTEIKEYKFHQNKGPILINDIDINKIVLSKGPYIKYVGGGLDGFCGGHEIF